MQSDTIIVVGAASRGIIQRGHESTAAMYKTYYAPNPFDNITEEDVEEYKEEIQRKTRGGICFLLTQFVISCLRCRCSSSDICNLEPFVYTVSQKMCKLRKGNSLMSVLCLNVCR